MTIRFSRSANGTRSSKGAGLGEGELHLIADHRPAERRVGFLPPGQRIVRDACRADVAVVEQVTHARHDHRIGHHRVGLVDLVQRDAAQLQPPGAGVCALLDHRGKRGDGKNLAGHRNLGARIAERIAEDALALTEPVNLRGIEQRDAECQRAMHDVAGGARRVGVAVAPFTRAELPGAQPDPLTRPTPSTSTYFMVPTLLV